MKAKRFLHIFPNFGPGGMELRVTRIINGMGPGIRHSIVALLGNYDARHSIDAGIAFECLPAPPQTGTAQHAWALRSIIREVKPDLLLTYNWGSIDAMFAACSLPLQRVVHHECGFSSEEERGLKPARVWARRVLLRRASAVAVTSRTMADIAVRKFKVSPGKVRWIRTGIDVNRFRPGLSRDWRHHVGIGDDELLFGFVGVLRAEKNLGFLLRAFTAAAIPNSKLAIIGDGAERQALQHAVQENGMSERVIFAGRVPDPAVCLPSLDAFVLCSTTEQTSNALLEAMSCGLPAISTDVGDSRELLGDTGTPAVVSPGDLDGLIAALKTLANSPECRQQLGSANRGRCLEHYRVDRMVREYEALYMRACGLKPVAYRMAVGTE